MYIYMYLDSICMKYISRMQSFNYFVYMNHFGLWVNPCLDTLERFNENLLKSNCPFSLALYAFYNISASKITLGSLVRKVIVDNDIHV